MKIRHSGGGGEHADFESELLNDNKQAHLDTTAAVRAVACYITSLGHSLSRGLELLEARGEQTARRAPSEGVAQQAAAQLQTRTTGTVREIFTHAATTRTSSFSSVG